MDLGRSYQLFGFFCCLCVFYFCWGNSRGDRFRRALPVAFFVSFVFITIQFKSISMPIITYAVIGLIGIPALVYGLMFRYELLLIVAAIYIPHNAILPADFGGIQEALNGTNIVLGALILGMFTGAAGERERYLRKSPANILMLIFIGTAALAFTRGSLFYGSVYYTQLIPGLWRFLSPLVLFMIFLRMLPNRETTRIIVGILMIVVIMAIYLGLLEWVNLGFGTYTDFKHRLGGLNKHPNVFGAFIAYYTGLFWGPALVNFRQFSGKLLLFPFLLALRLIIPTNSRGAWISLPPALLTITFFKSRILVLIVGLVVILPVIIFPSLIPDTIRYRFKGPLTLRHSEDIYDSRSDAIISATESQAVSIRTRGIILDTGLKLWMHNIFFGYGYGTFSYNLREYSGGEVRGTAHNGWLNMLVEMGLVSVASLMALLAYFMYCAYQAYRRERNLFLKGFALGYLGCVPAILVANTTGQRFDHVDLLAIFWMLSACIVMLHNINRQELKEQQELRRKGIIT